MEQRGGIAHLTDAQCARALESYAQWAERKPEAALKFDFEKYVDFVQRKWAENDQQAEVRADLRELHQAARVAENAVHTTFDTLESEAVRPALKLAGMAAKVYAAIYDVAFGWATGEPQQTAQQARDEAQAAGNIETQHARATASEMQANEVARDWQQHWQKAAQQEAERDPRLAAMMQLHVMPTARTEREPDRDRDYERER